jgi:predicted polyphosphate/ATP-dependent NAD kinase
MRKISPMISASVSSKILKPVLIASGAAVVFVSLLLVQQNNINSLDQKIVKLSARIVQASSIDERLKLEKDVVGFEKDKTIIQNGAYTNLVQALGGLVLSMTAWVGYQNFRVGEKNLKVSEDKQVTERFSKSIEHLGSDKIDVRLGGIYALEQIAIDSAKYHWTIVEILSAFVRERSAH